MIGCRLVPFLMGHILNSIIASHGRSKIIRIIGSILMMLIVLHLMHVLLLLLVNRLTRLLDHSSTDITSTSWS